MTGPKEKKLMFNFNLSKNSKILIINVDLIKYFDIIIIIMKQVRLQFFFQKNELQVCN